MSDKTPDKATNFDDDIPTYTGKDSVKDSTPAEAAAEKPKKSSLFQRPGRAEPQVIKPKKAEEALLAARGAWGSTGRRKARRQRQRLRR
ncbi:hypothetical protein ACGLFO_13350 [Corynebacterium hesseae]|uniref:hypothetical protein n=1 Tax=Corynebacterium hesseae TaxID=2913502 RepID=UPI00373F5E97